MRPVQPWCRVTVMGADGAALISYVLEGPGAPDMGAVDEVARLALMAGRLGGAVVLADVSPALRALLALAGSRSRGGGAARTGGRAARGSKRPGTTPYR